MFDKLKQIKGMGQMGGQMFALQRQLMKLSKQKVEIEEGSIKIVLVGSQLTGNQKLETLQIDGENRDDLKEVLNRALNQSGETLLKKLQEMSGGLKGMMGGMGGF